jgi:hypothetical protein
VQTFFAAEGVAYEYVQFDKEGQLQDLVVGLLLTETRYLVERSFSNHTSLFGSYPPTFISIILFLIHIEISL